MRRSLILLVIATGAAAPSAQAARVWGPPAPLYVKPYAMDNTHSADVGADGTTVTGDLTLDEHIAAGNYGDPHSFFAAVGDRPPAELVSGGQAVTGAVAALPGGGAVAATSQGHYEDATTEVRVAGSDGVFGPPQSIGKGSVVALRTDRAGDAALVVGYSAVRTPFQVTITEAYAPAGGTFGPPVTLPLTGLPQGLAFGDDGTATVISRPTDSQDLQAVSRVRGGAVGPVATLTTPPAALPKQATGPLIAADAHGRALVAWTRDATLYAARRTDDGTWTTPAATTLPFTARDLQAASDPAGDAIVAWRDESARIRAMTGSLAGAVLSAPTVVDQSVSGGLELAERADGSAVIADSAGITLSAVARDGTGPFGTPTVAGCPASLSGAWLTDAGDATLLAGDALIHDAPGPGPAAPCSPLAPVLRVTRRQSHHLIVRISGTPADSLVLTWRARGRVLTRRAVTIPETVILAVDASARGVIRHHTRTKLVLRRRGTVVAVRRVRFS